MEILTHKFVDFIPETVEDGILYISMEFRTAIHKCVCGCGNEVVTPFSPTDWSLKFNGDTVSLNPSIGNWNFSCQSHYWIIEDKISYAGKWTTEEITKGRINDSARKELYYSQPSSPPLKDLPVKKRKSFLRWLINIFKK